MFFILIGGEIAKAQIIFFLLIKYFIENEKNLFKKTKR